MARCVLQITGGGLYESHPTVGVPLFGAKEPAVRMIILLVCSFYDRRIKVLVGWCKINPSKYGIG